MKRMVDLWLNPWLSLPVVKKTSGRFGERAKTVSLYSITALKDRRNSFPARSIHTITALVGATFDSNWSEAASKVWLIKYFFLIILARNLNSIIGPVCQQLLALDAALAAQSERYFTWRQNTLRSEPKSKIPNTACVCAWWTCLLACLEHVAESLAAENAQVVSPPCNERKKQLMEFYKRKPKPNVFTVASKWYWRRRSLFDGLYFRLQTPLELEPWSLEFNASYETLFMLLLKQIRALC